MNGLQELPLVLPHTRVVHLPHQFGVLVDQPRLPENICRCVLHLRGDTARSGQPEGSAGTPEHSLTCGRVLQDVSMEEKMCTRDSIQSLGKGAWPESSPCLGDSALC